MKGKVSAVLFMLLWFCAAGVAEEKKEKTDAPLTIEQRVDKLFEEWDNPASPGAAVAVVRDGMVVYRKGFGSAQLEYGVPITPSTVFHVASVSKQFPAFAVSMLEREGKLSVDDDIRKHLPWVPDFGQKITIRHLLNHTSGLRDQWELLIMAGWRMEDVITQKDIIRLVKKQRELNFKPGEQYMYSNTGFTLLAEVVSKVSGKPFVQWVQENIFVPLGMSSSHFHIDHQRIVKNRAYSYRQDRERGLVKSILSYANVGATSLFTTVEDMANWMRNYSERRVGDETLVARMFQKGLLNSGKKINYGRGLGIGEYKGLKRISHGGADAGFRSSMVYFPQQRFGVVVLSNLAQFQAGTVAYKIVDLYLKDHLKEEGAAPKPKKPYKLSKKKLKVFSGQYWLAGLKLLRDIKLEDDTLFYVRTSGYRSELVPISESAFFMKDSPDAVVSFSDVNYQKTQTLTVVVADDPATGRRVVPYTPSQEELSEYAGRYLAPELDVFYKLRAGEKGLIIDFKNASGEGFTPLIEDVFSYRGYSTITFQRDQAGKPSGFTVDSGRIKNLKFVRMD